MRKFRGIIALVVSVCLGLLAAKAASWYVQRLKQRRPEPEVRQAAPPQPASTPARFSASITSGMRVFTLQVDDVSGVSRQLKKGDLVDVIATTPLAEERGGSVSRVILQAVRLHELSFTEDGAKSGKRLSRRGGWTAGLLVRPEEAVAAAAAAATSRIRLLARNEKDTEPVSISPAVFTAAGGVDIPAAADRDLGRLIKPGLRAMTLEVADTDGMCARLRRGDRVDIIVTCPWGNIALQGENIPGETGVLKETHRTSRILLQDVEVIATDAGLHWAGAATRPVTQVTLLLTPQQAEKLTVLADSKKGRSLIRLVSRNSADHERVQTSGAELLDLLTQRRPYLKVDMIRGPVRKHRIFYR
jgi:Flp pilus assembly protein CpaB